MPFTVEEFRDLVRILEEKPEWRAELRRWVLSDELLSLPEQMASLRADTDRRFQELIEAQKRTEGQIALLTGQVATLAEAQRQTDKQVAELVQTVRTLVVDVGFLKGEMLESRYRTKGYAYFGGMVRRAHVLSSDELISLFEDARERGLLSEAEVDQITLVDLVVRGKRKEDGTEVYLVVEVSWGVGPADVERAAQRASLLAKVGTPTIPVVAGEWVTTEADQLARAKQVWKITDGRAVSPE
ncbi:MAG TPA: hypothetical protein VGX03_22485 [Candidatus Binatia bacterium]|jgi:hypothetical protein|nr:hypothetical protein [Candidatus Binatia bacterium]